MRLSRPCSVLPLRRYVAGSLHEMTVSNGIQTVDFSRIIVMRTASDFDRPWPGEAATTNLFYAEQGAFEPAVQNIYLAGIKVVEGILDGWNSTFAKGVNATNYIGMFDDTLQASNESNVDNRRYLWNSWRNS